ncbi:acyl carrier protein [Lachnospiraceae bacterium KH1T2]|jgi:acyl carrier protein|nr:acyl carrier protein [Lachnospiraceae bacterium KH1T2]
MDTKARLNEVFRDVFDDDTIEITDEMTADDIDDWDSLTHVQLVVAVEEAFKCKFSTVEVMKLKNVGEFIKLIDRKTGNA